MIGTMVLALADDGLETTRLEIAAFIRQELAKTDHGSPDMKTVMLNAIDTLKTYPDQEIVELHRDGDDRVS
ncbi:hypothetical protein BEE12_22675 (plasmid) [Pantoea agglomerans]|uniref:DUF2767 family protein n=1 Tax=Enterobacter agglomerans TaxID=549 RepID=UPI00083D6EF5|nr:DUF2767 family protein [Pantoea agglomerans]AOE42599.1 hypothetical protein BEE12_22675 [Pantoea agglomerans]